MLLLNVKYQWNGKLIHILIFFFHFSFFFNSVCRASVVLRIAKLFTKKYFLWPSLERSRFMLIKCDLIGSLRINYFSWLTILGNSLHNMGQ